MLRTTIAVLEQAAAQHRVFDMFDLTMRTSFDVISEMGFGHLSGVTEVRWVVRLRSRFTFCFVFFVVFKYGEKGRRMEQRKLPSQMN